jgi:hypothetical protein
VLSLKTSAINDFYYARFLGTEREKLSSGTSTSSFKKTFQTERIFEKKNAKEIECDEKYMKVGQVRA